MIKHNGKAVTDIKVIQNKAQVDVNKAVWNGVTVWQRVKDLAGHTTVTINPTSYSESSDAYEYSYTGKKPSVTAVVFNDGSGSVPLTTDDYSVSYTGDYGTISHYDATEGEFVEGTKSASAKVTITGKGSYTGSVDKAYSVSHTYRKLRWYIHPYKETSEGVWKRLTQAESTAMIADAYIQCENKYQMRLPTEKEIASGLYYGGNWMTDTYISVLRGTWTVTTRDGYVVRGWSAYNEY